MPEELGLGIGDPPASGRRKVSTERSPAAQSQIHVSWRRWRLLHVSCSCFTLPVHVSWGRWQLLLLLPSKSRNKSFLLCGIRMRGNWASMQGPHPCRCPHWLCPRARALGGGVGWDTGLSRSCHPEKSRRPPDCLGRHTLALCFNVNCPSAPESLRKGETGLAKGASPFSPHRWRSWLHPSPAPWEVPQLQPLGTGGGPGSLHSTQRPGPHPSCHQSPETPAQIPHGGILTQAQRLASHHLRCPGVDQRAPYPGTTTGPIPALPPTLLLPFPRTQGQEDREMRWPSSESTWLLSPSQCKERPIPVPLSQSGWTGWPPGLCLLQ